MVLRSCDWKKSSRVKEMWVAAAIVLLVNMNLYNQLSYYHHDLLASTAVLCFYLCCHTLPLISIYFLLLSRHIYLWFCFSDKVLFSYAPCIELIYCEGWTLFRVKYFTQSVDKLIRKWNEYEMKINCGYSSVFLCREKFKHLY